MMAIAQRGKKIAGQFWFLDKHATPTPFSSQTLKGVKFQVLTLAAVDCPARTCQGLGRDNCDMAPQMVST